MKATLLLVVILSVSACNLHAHDDLPRNVAFLQLSNALYRTNHHHHPNDKTAKRTLLKTKGTTSGNNNNTPFHEKPSTPKPKKLVLVRHGRTYMNEYLSQPGSQWGDPGFTDVFPSDCDIRLYRDSPLSRQGLQQAERLSEWLVSSVEGTDITGEIELIAVSPLTRALQTLEIGILNALKEKSEGTGFALAAAATTTTADDGPGENQSGGTAAAGKVKTAPIVALPFAAERLYLLSDLGSNVSSLSKRFPYVDFRTEFHGSSNHEEWWFTPPNNAIYKEWRPNDQGQTYACPGEPDEMFHQRMKQLYNWLDAREESTICLVCHWGVLEWLTGDSFENCEIRIVDFGDIKQQGSSRE